MKLIIFDCDGVLVNSEEIYLAAELEFLASIGVIFERGSYTQAFMGLSPAMWKTKLQSTVEQKSGGTLPPDFFERLDELTSARMDKHLAALPEARLTISGITALRCVASSTPSARLHWKLQHTGLISLFDPHIFSSDMVRNGKPAPDLFLHAAAAMGAHPDECVVVEDSVNGVMAGKAAGMHVIGFTAGGHCGGNHGDSLLMSGADTIVCKYGDLVAALNGLGTMTA
ncbi:HAD family hydrolase (plasmid) [Mesorhizobium sp. AR07]|uniref:HAD family hydrolase n=1 Tax=Mesorhizobium sp. AR07 TaxID=2865838 RepID=UPI0021609C05|nr:HAD family hydrolase [Mesorhizobium sp. AR07]UVK48207.1 HAD family hydrolase [Mesorhizobium sp. AR07]